MYRNLGSALSNGVPPSRTAIFEPGHAVPKSVSYGELDALISSFARGFDKRGLGRGSRIAVIAANSSTYLAIVFGALRAGITAVPVNYKLPKALIAFILKDSGASLVFSDGARHALVPNGIECVDMDAIDSTGAITGFCDSGPFDAALPSEGDIALIIYTSGSSGVPKGVMFSHLAHLWALDNRTNLASPVAQRTVVAAPLYHQNGLASAQATLGSGGTVILLPTFEVEAFARAIADNGVEMITAVPTMIAMLIRRTDLIKELDFSKVTLVRVSSAPSTPELIADIGRVFPRAKVVNGFGTTEGGPIFFGPHPGGLPQPPLSVGYAHPDVTLRLMHDGREVEDEGVLEIKSRAVMMGYLNKPDLSAKVMTPDGFYITGDIFRRDKDGFFFFVGRADDMFNCGGENIFPGDVESMLMRHPAIAEVCVVPVADAIKGQKPVAFVVLRSGAKADEQELKAFTLTNGPAYQHPRRIFFVDELPLAGTNKIDRRALAERAVSMPAA